MQKKYTQFSKSLFGKIFKKIIFIVANYVNFYETKLERLFLNFVFIRFYL